MRPCRSFVVISVCLSLFVASRLHAQELDRRDVRSSARVLASAGIAGRFGEPICGEGRLVEPHEEAGFTGPLARRGAGGDALVIDTGGLLEPHGVARFAARDLPQTLADLVQALGYDALALGENDLGAPRARVLEVLRLFAARGVPYLASNLSCDEPASAVCASVLDASDAAFRMHVGTEEAAVLSMLDPDVLERIAPDRAEGLRFAPIADALPSAVRAARGAGATLVVAILDLTSAEAFALARELPADARPDLVLLAHEGEDLLFARPATVTPAISAPPQGGGVEVLLGRSDAMAVGFEMLAVPLDEANEHPAPAVTAFATAVGEAYCRAYGAHLPGGHLAREIDVPDVVSLSAQIVREFAGADVAFLNEGAIDAAFRPADPDQLSHSDFYIALEYDEPLQVADVPASWLLEALQRARTRGLATPGLDHEAEELAEAETSDLRVRDRAPVDGALYRVATIRFLAAGGDGALPELPEGTSWRTLEHTMEDGTVRYHSLRDVVVAALERENERDPRDARDDPNTPPEWVIRGGIDGDFAGSNVANPAMYDAALLATETSIAMGLEVNLVIDATAPDYTWENRVYGSFRTQWAPGSDPGVAGAFVEANDQIQLRSMASWRGLRAHDGDVWIPDPYIEAFLETEVTRPDDRAFHWLLVRPTIGARFPLTEELDVKLQVGLQTQALQPDGAAEAGAGALVLLRPWTILEVGDRSLSLEGNADFFVIDLFEDNRWQLRGQLDMALDLAGPLAVTFGGTLYAQQDPGGDVGFALTATAGLRLAAVTRVVGP
ncbi:MAG: 5'-nucleotidase C-terminal domain-containing protein [Deltaproteobacteria bacterium]|nr:5'-nucleotidase C-terminal domain-containing protein [Deltaproteobacteria bacterium]